MRYRADHIHLYASDIEATAEWYRRVLDAEILRSRQSDGRMRTDLRVGGLMLYLSDAKRLAANLGWTLSAAAPSPHMGLDHFGLAVDDLDAAAAELRERGADISFGPKTLRPGAACLYLRAPDGVTIEILSRDLRVDALPVEVAS